MVEPFRASLDEVSFTVRSCLHGLVFIISLLLWARAFSWLNWKDFYPEGEGVKDLGILV